MTRWLKWGVALVVLLAIAVVGLRGFKARQAQTAALGLVKPPPTIDLASSDVFIARPVEMTRTLAVSGGLKAVDSAVVKARVSAEIKTLSVREGDRVKAGQVIGQLDVTELDWRLKQTEHNAASAKAQLDIASRALVNNRALVEQGFISATGLETSVSNEASAQSTYQAAVAAVELTRKAKTDAVLVAPINGIVSQRLAQAGERVAVDGRIVEIVDLSRIELEAAVAPEDVTLVQLGQVARLEIDGLAKPVAAKVARINPSTQAGTRAVMVYLAVEPDAALRQGLFAKGTIDLQRKNALAVPASAVRVDQARPYVLAVADGKVQKRDVALGARGDAQIDARRESIVEVTSGIDAGATVLRGTAGALRDGTAVRMSTPKP